MQLHHLLLAAASSLLGASLVTAHPEGTRPTLTRTNSDPTPLGTSSGGSLRRTSSSPAILPSSSWTLACPNNLGLTCTDGVDLTGVDTCCTHAKGIVVLALQWVTTIGKADTFNIHGLWPDFCDGTYMPNGCDDKRKYPDVSKYMPSDLKSRLDQSWISYKGDNPSFWTYEWAKHGTCMSAVEPRCFDPSKYTEGQEVVPYYEKVLELYNKYNLYGALSKAGITPQPFASGKTFSRESMLKAFKAGLGVDVQMNCTKGGELDHVNLMFKVQGRNNFVLIDNFQVGNCKEDVKYPAKFDSTRPPPPPPPPPSTGGKPGGTPGKPGDTPGKPVDPPTKPVDPPAKPADPPSKPGTEGNVQPPGEKPPTTTTKPKHKHGLLGGFLHNLWNGEGASDNSASPTTGGDAKPAEPATPATPATPGTPSTAENNGGGKSKWWPSFDWWGNRSEVLKDPKPSK